MAFIWVFNTQIQFEIMFINMTDLKIQQKSEDPYTQRFNSDSRCVQKDLY